MSELSAIIILHYGSPDMTHRCICSVLSGQVVPDIFLVDNDPEMRYPVSDKLTSCNPSESEFCLTYLPQPFNRGFAAGVNVGIRAALEQGKELFLLLNNDVEVAHTTIGRVLSLAQQSQGLAGGVELRLDEKNGRTSQVIFAGGDMVWREVPVYLRTQRRDLQNPYDTEFVQGSCMAVPLCIIKQIGMMDESLWAYGEDVDYCIRAARAGFSLSIDPKALLWHRVRHGRHLRNYLYARNSIRLVKRYAAGTDFIRGIVLGFMAAAASLVRPERKGKFAGYIDGVMEGIR